MLDAYRGEFFELAVLFGCELSLLVINEYFDFNGIRG